MIWQGSPLGFDGKGRPISHDGNEPTLIIGPPGSNKSMGQAAVELLNDEGERTFFVWDPSLELAAICANWRRKVCGAENVFVINGYDMLSRERPDLKSSKWNPLREVARDSSSLSDICVAMGDALVPSDSNQMQKHFVDAARSGITGMIKAEIIEADETGATPSLPNVRARLTQSSAKLRATIKRILEKHPTDFDLQTRLSSFADEIGDERRSVLSNIESAMAWASDALCRDMVTDAGACFRTMRDRPTTIFCGLPPVEEKPAYMRLVLSMVLRGCYRADAVPATLLIDEAYVLGRHEEVPKAQANLRKHNCRMTLVYQSVSQAQQHYPDTWGLFTSGAVMGFRAPDEETARWLSFRAGEEVVPSPTFADPSSPAETRGRPSWGPAKRERIPAGKMFSMPRGIALVWLPGDDPPRRSRVDGYYDLPKTCPRAYRAQARELAARADPNPYFRGKAKPARNPRGWRAGLGWKAAVAAVIVAGVISGGATLWPGAASSPVAGGQSFAHPPSHATTRRPAFHGGNSSPRLRP